jgi:curved DNA-binding protein
MASRDFYDILGVGRKASPDEIKSAYRKLARQLHPDVNKASDAQKKFTEVQNAYDVLSDEKKRGMYDQFGSAAFESGASQEAASRAGRGPSYTWSNVGGRGGSGANPNMGFDPEDLGSIFESMFGGGAGPTPRSGGGGSRRKAHSKRHAPEHEPEAAPSVRELHVEFMTAARGGPVSVRVGDGPEARTIEVRIPAGIETGGQLRVRAASGGGGDIIFTVMPQSHRYFRRGEHEDLGKGLDLYIDVPVSIAEATLGAQVSVPTLEGTVELAIPSGSPSGRRLRLRGLGIVDGQGRKGDLYAIVKIVPPPSATLSDLEATALRDIAARGGPYRSW